MRWRRHARAAIAAMLSVLIGGWALAHFWLGPLPDWRRLRPSAVLVTDRAGEPLRFFLSPDDKWRLHVPLGDISPIVRDTLIQYEDRRFFQHPGFDPLAILRATGQNLAAGHVVSGGSTLTMQVARLLEPKPRTVLSKIHEVLRALQLERRYSKAEILNIYFNIAPYGGNIEGVAAASWLYFGKAPDRLGLAEAALLVALPQSPEQRRSDRHPEASRAARQRVLDRLHGAGAISSEEHQTACDQPVPEGRWPLPFAAPHQAEYLARSHPDATQLASTLDRRIQQEAQRLLEGHLAMHARHGITNGAVVIVENHTRAVRALVGSRDYFDTAASGFINGARAMRSPGSALKPFVYARALDAGIISEAKLVSDVPVDYSGYRPENFNSRYSGLVAPREALVHSLNVPAVNIEAKLGDRGLSSILSLADFAITRDPRRQLGLSLVLGGGEVSLVELAGLYSSLADGGAFKPLRTLESDPVEPHGVRLFSPAAAWLVAEWLTDRDRGELPENWQAAVAAPKIAWKTGTSYGRRDAWSLGVNRRWTVGVWMGNFDARGVPELVGSSTAGPLLLALAAMLETHGKGGWMPRPDGVGQREVCALSGMLPGPDCPHRKRENHIRSVSPAAPCDFHRAMDVDEDSGHRLCSHCREGRRWRREVAVVYPSDVATWLAQTGYSAPPLPLHNPACTRDGGGDPPVIRSPQDGGVYRPAPKATEAGQLLLSASVSNEVDRLYWFIDGALYWSGSPLDRVFWPPQAGAHRLVCMDGRGLQSEINIRVE